MWSVAWVTLVSLFHTVTPLSIHLYSTTHWRRGLTISSLSLFLSLSVQEYALFVPRFDAVILVDALMKRVQGLRNTSFEIFQMLTNGLQRQNGDLLPL